MSEDAWSTLRRYTAARIGLGRVGASLPTREVLKFSMAHAQARDAVRTPMEWNTVEQGLQQLDLPTLRVASEAADRDIYLRRPDLGRRLNAESRSALQGHAADRPELLLVVGDGLSSTAVSANAVATIAALLPQLRALQWKLAPVLLASQARVALGDAAGEILQARAVVMLIGERPGLSSPDSLGAYLTWEPRGGRKDNERNCISNIRAGGFSADEAAFRLLWLLREAFHRRLTASRSRTRATTRSKRRATIRSTNRRLRHHGVLFYLERCPSRAREHKNGNIHGWCQLRQG